MSLVSGLLNQTLTSISSITKDGYGDVSTTVLYSDTPCRIQYGVTRVVKATGEVITYKIKLFLYPDMDIREGYQIVYDSKTYTVKEVDPKFDIGGQKSHLELWCN